MLHLFRRKISGSKEGIINLKRTNLDNSKLLIINADDMGLSHASNAACEELLDLGTVTSASVMIPGPASEEALNYSRLYNGNKVGIHLTLTSEWQGKRWRPVLGDKVSSLTDSKGYFYPTREELEKHGRLPEIEQEWKAQIEYALIRGITPTHLDCHMFSGWINSEVLKIYLRLGHFYDIPVLLNREKIYKWFKYDLKNLISEKEFSIDQLYIATPRNVRKGHNAYYRSLFRNLKPGINCLLVHPAFDDEQMKTITFGRKDYNSSWRQADFDFFSGEECRSLIKENDITLISWKDL